MKEKKKKFTSFFFFSFKKSIYWEIQELVFSPRMIVYIKAVNTLFIYYDYKHYVRFLKSFDESGFF